MKIEKSTVKIGLEAPVRLLHVTDTHLTLVDERDDARKHELSRRMSYPDKENNLYEQIAYAKAHCDLLLRTGDLIDFVSHANVEKAREIVADEHVLFYRRQPRLFAVCRRGVGG